MLFRSQETILEDYLLTRLASKAMLAENQQRLEDEGASQAVKDNVTALWTVSEDYFDAAMEEVKIQSGDMKHYLTDKIGLTSDKIEMLKQLYLE